jgi:hypothetical protein
MKKSKVKNVEGSLPKASSCRQVKSENVMNRGIEEEVMSWQLCWQEREHHTLPQHWAVSSTSVKQCITSAPEVVVTHHQEQSAELPPALTHNPPVINYCSLTHIQGCL